MHGSPFTGKKPIRVILPQASDAQTDIERQQLESLPRLLEEHRASLERELGGRFEFGSSAGCKGPRWLIGPFACNSEIRALGRPEPSGPEMFLDREREILVSDGKTPDEVTETYSYIRSLNRFAGGTWKIDYCRSVAEAIDRVRTEVQCSYPAFGLRKLDWSAICDRHIPKVERFPDPIAAFQEWLAELHDAHTWVRPVPAHGELPYELRVAGGRGIFTSVPHDSTGWMHGLRPGFELVGEDFAGWWRRTSASAHSKPFVVGRRMLSSPIGELRHLQARGPSGNEISWSETSAAKSWDPVVEWQRLPSGNGYLRIRAWLLGKNMDTSIDAAFEELQSAPKLSVDLRGNAGGNLLLAQSFRNRFLRKSGPVGWIQTTLPNGGLGPKEPILGEPSTSTRWTKPVRFLTDTMTYSAAEDALLGLQGLEHVKVIGEASGGGSGRMRLIRLLPGWRLTISTALTFDVNGRCLEGAGIPVDVPCRPGGDGAVDTVLRVADDC